jgi:hypothetical protein
LFFSPGAARQPPLEPVSPPPLAGALLVVVPVPVAPPPPAAGFTQCVPSQVYPLSTSQSLGLPHVCWHAPLTHL